MSYCNCCTRDNVELKKDPIDCDSVAILLMEIQYVLNARGTIVMNMIKLYAIHVMNNNVYIINGLNFMRIKSMNV